jgi:hypothetical protein
VDKLLVFLLRILHVPSFNSAQKLATSTDGFRTCLIISMQISDSALMKEEIAAVIIFYLFSSELPILLNIRIIYFIF